MQAGAAAPTAVHVRQGERKNRFQVPYGHPLADKRPTGPWSSYLLANIAWVIIAAIILRFNVSMSDTLSRHHDDR